MPSKRTAITIAATLAIIAGAALAASVIVGDAGIIKRLLHPHYVWIACLVGAELVAYGAYTLAYQQLFGLSLSLAALHTLHGFSPLAVSGGFVYDAKAPHGRLARPRVVVLSIAEYIVLAPAVFGAALVAIFTHATIPTGLTVPWAIGVPAGVVLAGTALAGRTFIGRVQPGLNRWLGLLIQELTGLSAGRWTLLLLGICLYWAAELAALFGALELFGASLALPALIIAYATGYVLTRRTLPAGLAGIAAGLLILALRWVGISYAVGVLATYSYLAVNVLLPIIYMALSRRLGQSS